MRRSSENEGLFEEVLKKSLVYSQKYGGSNSGKQPTQGGPQVKPLESTYKPSRSPDKRNNSSAKSDQLSLVNIDNSISSYVAAKSMIPSFLDYPHWTF